MKQKSFEVFCINKQPFFTGHDLQHTKLEVDDNIEPVNFKTIQEAIEKFKNHFEAESVTEIIDP